MQLSIERLALLLLIVAVIAMVARRLNFPYSVGLVLSGIAFALLPFSPDIRLTRNLIFTVLLPPLIFEAAFHLHWSELRRQLPVVLTMAVLGVWLSLTATAAGMHWLVGWDWTTALIFGAFISATDPVSVIATFREARARGRIKLLIESESLFNDGTAAVAFAVALGLLSSQAVSVMHSAVLFFATIAGGILCGALVAAAIVLLMWRTNDHLIEQTFTMIAAYGSFLLAEQFHCSGVLATLTTGLLVGNLGRLRVISDQGRKAVESLWEFAAFVANSLIFLLVGMRMAHQELGLVWKEAILAIAVVLASRAVAVYPCAAIFWPTRLRISGRDQHLLLWGGLRGALALALALSLPDAMARREEVIRITFAVVAFSICVQGSSLQPLLRRLGAVSQRTGATAAT